MVEKAARALVPGPIATTALATLVITDPRLLSELASRARFAGLALEDDVRSTASASGTVDFVLGAATGGVLLLPAGEQWVLIDGVAVESLRATDLSRPLARVVLSSAPATPDRRIPRAHREPGGGGGRPDPLVA